MTLEAGLVTASMDILGGLVQATCGIEDDNWEDDNVHRALTITQLKRAMAGHAYARGAICGLRTEEVISTEQAEQLQVRLDSLLATIHELSAIAWNR